MSDDKKPETALTKPAPAPIEMGTRGVIITTLEAAFRFANYVVAGGFAPKGLEKPEAVLVAIQQGAEVGMTPMQSLQCIAVINGRPAIFGDAALALVRASGLLESYTQAEIGTRGKEDYGYRVKTVRKGGGEIESTFTVADAVAAGLWKKAGPWSTYPARMLLFRARGFNLRDNFGDVLKGMRTLEEARDIPDIETTGEFAPPSTTGTNMTPRAGEGVLEDEKRTRKTQRQILAARAEELGLTVLAKHTVLDLDRLIKDKEEENARAKNAPPAAPEASDGAPDEATQRQIEEQERIDAEADRKARETPPDPEKAFATKSSAAPVDPIRNPKADKGLFGVQ